MKIPLPNLMRHWREREFERHLRPGALRKNLDIWAWFAKRPGLYRMATRMAIGTLGLLGRGKGAFKSLPLAGGWTGGRDLPVPQGGTFMAQYAKRQRDEGRRR